MKLLIVVDEYTRKCVNKGTDLCSQLVHFSDHAIDSVAHAP